MVNRGMSALIEPEVLVRAKSFLLDDREDTGYAVVDTQFQRDTWGATSVSTETRTRLQPINTLRLRGGEPDALLAPPQTNAYRELEGDAPAEPPLAVIEAKGETDTQQ